MQQRRHSVLRSVDDKTRRVELCAAYLATLAGERSEMETRGWFSAHFARLIHL